MKAEIGRIPAAAALNTPPQDAGLRDYQETTLQDLRNSGDSPVLVASPTGSGKTVIASTYIGEQRQQGKKVALLAHTDELIGQLTQAAEAQVGKGNVGVVQGEHKDFSKPVTVISHGTVASNPALVIPRDFKPDTLIIDEAHHSASEGYQDIIKTLGSEKLVGFTATPYRSDHLKLSDTYDTWICRVTPQQLIARGYLVPPTVVDVKLTDQAGREKQVNQANNLPELYAEAAAKARANGRKKIIIFGSQSPGYTPTEIVDRTARHLRSVGFRAEDILGTTNETDRKAAIQQFRRRNEGVLVNYGALNEGFDVPDTDAIVLGRDVVNRGTLAQIIGRALRPAPGKRDALVLNFSAKPAAAILRDVLSQTQAVGSGEGCGVLPMPGTKPRPAVPERRDGVAAATVAGAWPAQPPAHYGKKPWPPRTVVQTLLAQGLIKEQAEARAQLVGAGAGKSKPRTAGAGRGQVKAYVPARGSGGQDPMVRLGRRKHGPD